ncbi:hypothetical protein ABES23_06155 [Peribacillus frigoritolerans]|uniref:hypothetical protein n=1 Tax=Peribacillus frigoritolerans TaxID=450367 RepID=UPI003D2853D0
MKNEKLSKVNERLNELEAKKDNLQSEVNEILQAVEDSVQAYAMKDVDEATVEKAKSILDAKTKEIKETEEMIQRVKGVRKSVVLESIPFIKSDREKKVEAIQKRYDAKVSEVIEARNSFLRKMAELGSIRNEVGSANNEFNAVMIELGESPSIYGAALNEVKTFSPKGFTSEADCLGVKERVQTQAYSGNLPQWVGGVK